MVVNLIASIAIKLDVSNNQNRDRKLETETEEKLVLAWAIQKACITFPRNSI
jgi:hypothetical protein